MGLGLGLGLELGLELELALRVRARVGAKPRVRLLGDLERDLLLDLPDGAVRDELLIRVLPSERRGGVRREERGRRERGGAWVRWGGRCLTSSLRKNFKYRWGKGKEARGGAERWGWWAVWRPRWRPAAPVCDEPPRRCGRGGRGCGRSGARRMRRVPAAA